MNVVAINNAGATDAVGAMNVGQVILIPASDEEIWQSSRRHGLRNG